MPIYHPIHGTLVSHNDYLVEATALRAADFAVRNVGSGANVRPFVDVGYGKPLSVLVRWVYTGRFPEKHLFSNQKSMLVSSAIKDVTTTSAAANAVNILKSRVSPHSAFSGPSAQEEGTNLLYFSPAVASPYVTVTVNVVFEDFPTELFEKLRQLFTSLASVPIFMPAAGYLLGANTVVKLGADLGNSFLNGRPVLNENLPLDFNFGGGSIPKPGYWILCGSTIDTNKYKFDVNQGLVDSGCHVYDGDDPVVVLSLDGTPQPSLANFTSLLASTSLLGRFFSQKEGSEVALDSVLGAVKLYNDLSYRKKSEEIRQRLSGMKPDNKDYKTLLDQYAAFDANISEERLRLPALPQ